MINTQELQKEHKEIIRLVELMQCFDPNYAGPHGFDTEYDNWLAQLDAKVIDMMEDQAEWQSAVSNGFTFSYWIREWSTRPLPTLPGELTMNKQLFPTGQIVATPGALDLDVDFRPYLAQHVTGYWGQIGQEDWQENDLSVRQGFRILSAYDTVNGLIWIITEADWSVTTILTPKE